MLVYERTKERLNQHKELVYDLVVVGGGLSGVCSAITAARKGIKVALIQDRPVLGGNASSEVRVWALGATSHMGNNNRWAREGGLIDEIMVENLYRNKEGNPILFDALLLDKVLCEPNLSLFLNTTVLSVEKSDPDTIKAVVAFNSQNSTSYRFVGNLFCDASGDGIVGFLSGASFRVGAEEVSEFNEGFSPSDEYGQLLGHTIFLYPKVTNHPVKYIAPDFALDDMSVIPKLHQINPNQCGCNYWWFEYGGTKDTIADSEEIKQELWKVIYGAWNYIKNSGLYPEAENMTLEWVGNIPGKRESRRFEGLYMMTQHDIVGQRIFDDAVSYGGWAIDLHPAEGIYSSLPSCNQYHSKGIYSIPYRCFVNKDINNLFMAGRLISVSHVAFGSTRVMITSAHGGQAVGMAAALCVEKNCMPAELLNTDNMHQLQQMLNIDGQSIPFIPIDKKDNLASIAHIASSSTMTFNGFDFDGRWQCLDYSRGQLLPLKANIAYKIQVELNVEKETILEVELVMSSKKYNFTPDTLLQKRSYNLLQGEQELTVSFDAMLPEDQYAFIIFRRNTSVFIKTSTLHMTGILSVANKFNKAVNNLGKQIPPEGSGFEPFEFFTPDRRPNSENLGMKIIPALSCFNVDNLTNGYLRPHITPNAWVAEWDSNFAELTIEWERKQIIHFVKLFFDTDADHPMETIQWNHFENVMPFCVNNYDIYDDEGNKVYEKESNHQTINKIEFKEPLVTSSLKMVFNKVFSGYPISVFEIEIR